MSNQEELVIRATPAELKEQAQSRAEEWATSMKVHTDGFTKKAISLTRSKDESDVVEEIAGPITPTFPIPYPWWNILVAGPYQPGAGDPGGPFLPHKIFEPTEPAFMLGAVWMNPAYINWWPPGPSAAAVMGAFELTIRFETMNLTTVADGPDPAPIQMQPIGAWPVGPTWFKVFWRSIGNGHFPSPPQGQPHLYEMNVTADVTGPVPQAFAGYSTWVFDPDMEPPIWPPPITPPVFPYWRYDQPARFLVYTP